jgi:hypothetical protein
MPARRSAPYPSDLPGLADASRHPHSDDSAGKAVARSDNITLGRRQGQLRYARGSWLLATGGNACAGTDALSPSRVIRTKSR